MGLTNKIREYSLNKIRSFLLRSSGWTSPLLRSSVYGNNSIDTVSVQKAMTFAAVFACNRVATETMSTLPAHIIEKTGEGRNIVSDHPMAKLLTVAPNPDMNIEEFWEIVNPGIEMRGNAFIEIARNTRGKIVSLWPLFPDYMRVSCSNRSPVYTYHVPGETPVVIPNKNMWHIKFMPMGGLVGISPIAYAATTILTSIHGQNYGKKVFESGGLERIALISERPIKPGSEAEKDMLRYWEQTYGSKDDTNYGKVAMVSGVKPERIGISPADAQLLQLLAASSVDICSIFRIPLHKIQRLDDTIKANIEQQSIDFVQDSVLPRAIRIEKSINRSILENSERYFFKFNLDGLLRGDLKSRMEANALAIQNGIKSPNEVRAGEELNPYDGGEVFTRPLNMGGVNNQEKNKPLSENNRNSSGIDRSQRQARKEPTQRLNIRKNWRPVLVSAYSRILKKEQVAIRKAVKKYLLSRSTDDFSEWLETTFKDLDSGWAKDLAEAVSGMERAMADAAATEINASLDTDFRDWLDGYMDGFQERHANKTVTEIQAMIQEDIEATIKDIESRMDTWPDKADNEASNRITQSDGALALAVWGRNGIKEIIWGGGTCEFCSQLNGSVVGIGSSFIGAGGSLAANFSSNVLTPPLHNGCDCYISPA